MSVLLRDLIHIPETAGADDYVLRLTEGVGSQRVARTISDYVVTDDIEEAFDQALGLVAAALRDHSSRAAFLSGSFGSGKSHFMAVLYALLGHERAAREKKELQPVVARHDKALAGKNVLRLAYHFLDNDSVDATILGGYVRQIRLAHPGCELPAVYQSDKIIEDGENLRAKVGDDVFLAGLNRDTGGADGDDWSNVLEGDTWTAQRYDAARAAAPDSEQRRQLVSALVTNYFTSFTSVGDFVSLDEGLDAITRHAKNLKYDAVVMFLDELVLWLSFLVRDPRFGREVQKITKLVESGRGERAIPLVSIVARQMDLGQYFADTGGAVGVEQKAIDDAFRHQSGRFMTIVLGDDNLPYVAQERLLKPVDDAAKATIDDAFRALDRRPDVWDVLLDGANSDDSHRGSSQDEFRRTYPFSPALVSTLRTLASAMQRDRTALKVMQQLLVRRRDNLTIDDVVPVGDIFDLVVDGKQALTPEMAGRFRNARALYTDKLLPQLLADHALAADDVAALGDDHPFRADERLAKTLVLSAVAPEVPALRDLTTGRLAALNHGSITAPAFRGREGALVLTKLRKWSAAVPEIQITADTRDPVIRVRIADVDYESIVTKARGEDNHGRRQEKLKELIWEAMGLTDLDGDAFGVSRQPYVWRGSRRDIEVVFGNVRDTSWLTATSFQAGADAWRFVIDYPFDADGHSCIEDLNRVDALRAAGPPTRTVVWLPHFLTSERQAEVGRLFILDWLLDGPERWNKHANHLAEAERLQARIILENQRDALRQRLLSAIAEAYGATPATPGTLDRTDDHDRVLHSLHPEFAPASPVGHNLAAAFGNLLDQAHQAVYPDHPRFEPEDKEIRIAEVTAVRDAVREAQQHPDGRYEVTANRDTLRRIANPLGVGSMGETHFTFGDHNFSWATPINAALGRAGISLETDPVTVDKLRGWIRDAKPKAGLRPELVDVIICAWAERTTRAWYRHGAAIASPAPGSLTPEMELRPEPLPDPGAWRTAVDLVARIFGVAGRPHLTGQNVVDLAEVVTTHAASSGPAVRALTAALADAYRRVGATTDGPGRLATAQEYVALVDAVRRRPDPLGIVETLAGRALTATPEALATCQRTATSVAAAIEGFPWDRLGPLREAADGGDARATGARVLLDRLSADLTADQFAMPLEPALRAAEKAIFDWAMSAAPPTTDKPQAPKPARPSGSRRVTGAADLAAAADELRTFAAEHPGQPITVEWRVDN